MTPPDAPKNWQEIWISHRQATVRAQKERDEARAEVERLKGVIAKWQVVGEDALPAYRELEQLRSDNAQLLTALDKLLNAHRTILGASISTWLRRGKTALTAAWEAAEKALADHEARCPKAPGPSTKGP